jgi:hypothetical protein
MLRYLLAKIEMISIQFFIQWISLYDRSKVIICTYSHKKTVEQTVENTVEQTVERISLRSRFHNVNPYRNIFCKDLHYGRPIVELGRP